MCHVWQIHIPSIPRAELALDATEAASVGSSTHRPGAEGQEGSVPGHFSASSQCGMAPPAQQHAPVLGER